MDAPKKVVLEFLLRGNLECTYRATLGVHSVEDMFDGAVFATGIHCLQHHEQRVLGPGIKRVLQANQFSTITDQLSLGAFFVGKVSGLIRCAPQKLRRLLCAADVTLLHLDPVQKTLSVAFWNVLDCKGELPGHHFGEPHRRLAAFAIDSGLSRVTVARPSP